MWHVIDKCAAHGNHQAQLGQNSFKINYRAPAIITRSALENLFLIVQKFSKSSEYKFQIDKTFLNTFQKTIYVEKLFRWDFFWNFLCS